MKLKTMINRFAVAALLVLPMALEASAQVCETFKQNLSLRHGEGWAVLQWKERVYIYGTACRCWNVRCWTEYIDFTVSPPKSTFGNCETGPNMSGRVCVRTPTEGDGCDGHQSVPAGTGGETDDPSITSPASGGSYSISGSSWTSGGTTDSTELTNSCDTTPVVVDVDGNGYAMTASTDGVWFDLDTDGVEELLSWTAAGSDDAFLVVDRSGNGIIDDGRELFGNYSPQPLSPARNGFLALAVYDRLEEGGNADDVIDSSDGIYAFLRLWRDDNHNGDSEAGELTTLPSAGIQRLHLAYRESKRVDEHGNAFRYRAKVDGKDGDASRWAWDVFLVRQ